MRSSCSLCVCVSQLWMPKNNLCEIWYAYQGTITDHNGVLHKSLPSVCVYVFQFNCANLYNGLYFFSTMEYVFKCPLMFRLRIRIDFVGSVTGLRNLISNASAHFRPFTGRIQHSDLWSNRVTVIFKHNFKYPLFLDYPTVLLLIVARKQWKSANFTSSQVTENYFSVQRFYP
jgi:hypothetical protein